MFQSTRVRGTAHVATRHPMGARFIPAQLRIRTSGTYAGASAPHRKSLRHLASGRRFGTGHKPRSDWLPIAPVWPQLGVGQVERRHGRPSRSTPRRCSPPPKTNDSARVAFAPMKLQDVLILSRAVRASRLPSEGLSWRGIRRAKDGQNIPILPLPAASSRVFDAACGRSNEGAFSVEKRESKGAPHSPHWTNIPERLLQLISGVQVSGMAHVLSRDLSRLGKR